MRVAVLSDIHANKPALDAVLTDLEDGIDTFLFCGDLVGYYCWPDAVIDIARDHGFVGVRGNHDEALIQDTTFGFSGVAGEALRWTAGMLSADSREYLENLPYTRREQVDDRDVYMVHGSPSSPVEQYVYPEQVDRHFLREQNVTPDVLLLGHTHVPFAKQVGDTLVLNPGSVGQPRDGDPRAAYAVLDTDDLSAETCRVSYDIDRVADAVRDAGLPAMLAERLRSGQ